MGVRDRKMRYDTTGNKLRFSLVIQNFEKAGDLYSTFLAKLPKLFSRKRDNGILYVKLRLYINQLFFMQRWLMIRSRFILNSDLVVQIPKPVQVSPSRVTDHQGISFECKEFGFHACRQINWIYNFKVPYILYFKNHQYPTNPTEVIASQSWKVVQITPFHGTTRFFISNSVA